jgi:predicted house-cleaning NTP pyrophosphatase (Maf/HAM1 superfamily)
MIITAQAIFDLHLKGLHNYVKASVKTKEHYLIMAEAMLAVSKEILEKNLREDEALQIIEHALQDNKITYH